MHYEHFWQAPGLSSAERIQRFINQVLHVREQALPVNSSELVEPLRKLVSLCTERYLQILDKVMEISLDQDKTSDQRIDDILELLRSFAASEDPTEPA